MAEPDVSIQKKIWLQRNKVRTPVEAIYITIKSNRIDPQQECGNVLLISNGSPDEEGEVMSFKPYYFYLDRVLEHFPNSSPVIICVSTSAYGGSRLQITQSKWQINRFMQNAVVSMF